DASHQRLLGGAELLRRQLRHVVAGGDADLDDRAVDRRHVPRLPEQRANADGLERVVDAEAARELLDLLDGVARAGIDRVGGAELERQAALLLDWVDGDD